MKPLIFFKYPLSIAGTPFAFYMGRGIVYMLFLKKKLTAIAIAIVYSTGAISPFGQTLYASPGQENNPDTIHGSPKSEAFDRLMGLVDFAKAVRDEESADFALTQLRNALRAAALRDESFQKALDPEKLTKLKIAKSDLEKALALSRGLAECSQNPELKKSSLELFLPMVGDSNQPQPAGPPPQARISSIPNPCQSIMDQNLSMLIDFGNVTEQLANLEGKRLTPFLNEIIDDTASKMFKNYWRYKGAHEAYPPDFEQALSEVVPNEEIRNVKISKSLRQKMMSALFYTKKDLGGLKNPGSSYSRIQKNRADLRRSMNTSLQRLQNIDQELIVAEKEANENDIIFSEPLAEFQTPIHSPESEVEVFSITPQKESDSSGEKAAVIVTENHQIIIEPEAKSKETFSNDPKEEPIIIVSDEGQSLTLRGSLPQTVQQTLKMIKDETPNSRNTLTGDLLKQIHDEKFRVIYLQEIAENPLLYAKSIKEIADKIKDNPKYEIPAMDDAMLNKVLHDQQEKIREETERLIRLKNSSDPKNTLKELLKVDEEAVFKRLFKHRGMIDEVCQAYALVRKERANQEWWENAFFYADGALAGLSVTGIGGAVALAIKEGGKRIVSPILKTILKRIIYATTVSSTTLAALKGYREVSKGSEHRDAYESMRTRIIASLGGDVEMAEAELTKFNGHIKNALWLGAFEAANLVSLFALYKTAKDVTRANDLLKKLSEVPAEASAAAQAKDITTSVGLQLGSNLFGIPNVVGAARDLKKMSEVKKLLQHAYRRILLPAATPGDVFVGRTSNNQYVIGTVKGRTPGDRHPIIKGYGVLDPDKFDALAIAPREAFSAVPKPRNGRSETTRHYIPLEWVDEPLPPSTTSGNALTYPDGIVYPPIRELPPPNKTAPSQAKTEPVSTLTGTDDAPKSPSAVTEMDKVEVLPQTRVVANGTALQYPDGTLVRRNGKIIPRIANANKKFRRSLAEHRVKHPVNDKEPYNTGIKVRGVDPQGKEIEIGLLTIRRKEKSFDNHSMTETDVALTPEEYDFTITPNEGHFFDLDTGRWNGRQTRVYEYKNGKYLGPNGEKMVALHEKDSALLLPDAIVRGSSKAHDFIDIPLTDGAKSSPLIEVSASTSYSKKVADKLRSAGISYVGRLKDGTSVFYKDNVWIRAADGKPLEIGE